MNVFAKVQIFVACCSASGSFAGVLGGPIFNAATGNAYYILTPDTWINSEQEAMRLGGHLVTINDVAEQGWIFSTFSRFDGGWKNLWIGLTDTLAEGKFVWASGETATFTNWYEGEPNNANGNEHYGELSYARSGEWNDVPNSWPTGPLNNGIVEVIPLPTPEEIWNANAGLTIIASSPLHSSGIYDARDAFGGTFGTATGRDVVFSDTQSPSFVHFIEWRTPDPVTLKSIRLFADIRPPVGGEFSTFTLKAKPIGSSTFSTILYYYFPPHPYVLKPNGVLTEANVVPTTATDFRAEFLTYPSQPTRGPRIIEIDGFDQYLPINFVPISARLAVQLKWPSGGTNDFQVQWSSVLSPDTWFDLGPPFRGGDSFTDPIADAQRFYRVLQLE